MEHKKIWVFPSYDTVRIACNGTVGVKVAYYAARRKIEHLDDRACELTTGVLDGKPVLIFRWQPDVDARLPTIIDTIARLVGGTALRQELEDTYAKGS